MRNMNSSAVSPVVGIMLMLVVTIIIAAVVSAFTGGFVSEQKSAPQAVLECTFDTTPGFQGLHFTHKGGDDLNLKMMELTIVGCTEPDLSGKLTYLTPFSNGNTLDESLSDDWGDYRFQKLGTMDSGGLQGFNYGDTTIRPGDEFMIYFDQYYTQDSLEEAGHRAKAGIVVGKGMWIREGDICKYKLIDVDSQKNIQSGEFVIP